jgi:hypothetical protein
MQLGDKKNTPVVQVDESRDSVIILHIGSEFLRHTALTVTAVGHLSLRDWPFSGGIRPETSNPKLGAR